MAIWTISTLSSLERTKRIDAEYYQDIYKRALTALITVGSKSLTTFGTVSDGNHLAISQYYSPTPGVRYLRGQDVTDFFIGSGTPVYIPEDVWASAPMLRSRFLPGDILLSIVGTIGSVALVPLGEEKLTGSCKIAVIRPYDSRHSAYLATFLLSLYGQLQIRRLTRGAVQMGLILEDFDQILVPPPTKAVCSKITALVNEAQRKRSESIEAFRKAISTMMASLNGEAESSTSAQRHQTRTVADLSGARRWDAEFYMVSDVDLLDRIAAGEHQSLSAATLRIQSGVTPAADEYSSEGAPIFKVEGLTAAGLAEASGAYVPHEWASRNVKGQIGKRDALVLAAAHHRSYIGKTGLIVDDVEVDARAVGELIILEFRPDVSAECMTVFLNLPPVRAALQRQVRGNTAHLYPKDILDLPVPVFSDELVRDVTDYFQAAYKAERSAQTLLEEAVAAVEGFVVS